MMRFRDIYMFGGGILVLLVVFLTDPSVGVVAQLPVGSATVGLMVNILISMWFVGFLHYSRKGILDYIDLEIYFKEAIKTPTSAGLALIAVGLMMISISIVIHAAVK